MKIVILAAGRGTRMGGLTQETPKSMLKVNGKTLIQHSLENLAACGVARSDIGIIVGFQKEKLMLHCGNDLTYIENTEYEKNNTMGSFWYSRNFVDGEDCLYMHADVLYDASIIADCMKTEPGVSHLVVDTVNWTDESMKVEVVDGKLVEATKELPEERTHGDWIGIAKIGSRDIDAVYNMIDHQLEQGEHGSYMAVKCFTPLAQKGHSFHIVPTNNRSWIEVDFEHELNKAQSVMCVA